MSTKSEAEIRAERDEAARAPRQFVSFAFFKLNPSFRRALSEAEASDAVAELCGVLEDAGRKFLIYPYTTLGVRADADFLLWRISFQLEDFEQLTAAMLRTRMGKYLDTTSSYLSMTKTSIYVDDHFHEDQESTRNKIVVGGRKYLFVYPFVKTRAWYLLPKEERQRIMKQHIRVGHDYTSVKLNTTYSFGLDDQDFVVAFETNYPDDFLDLVQELRETESSIYTQRDTPIYTCTRQDLQTMLAHVAGVEPK